MNESTQNDVHIIINGNEAEIQFPDSFWRDYFAGQFLTTVVINGVAAAEEVASACYRMADAMLKARAAK